MTESQMRVYYILKSRNPLKFTLRDTIIKDRMHICPGCIYHDIPRQKIVFNRRAEYGHKAYVVYWRTHMKEYRNLLDKIQKI